MTRIRAVAVVGYKDSGKTRVVEALVRELTGRGHRVGTLKHTAEDVPLDTPGKDTWRHREAGSRASAIIHEKSAAVFIDRYVSVNEAADMLGNVDFIVIEGFKSLDTMARILVPREPGEIEELFNGLEIAVADLMDGGIKSGGSVPVIPVDRPKDLGDLVEGRAFPILAGLDCGGCGYKDCKGLAKAILDGEAEAERCVSYAPGFTLKVDDTVIPLGPFVQDVTMNTVLGLVGSFKGVDNPRKVELSFEVGERDG
jgi:molybdopterin-guanine dinucleotide biosynthesis protein B